MSQTLYGAPASAALDDDQLLDELLRPGGLTAVFQPIVRLADSEVIAYEGLSRSRTGVTAPRDAWFEAATRTDRRTELEVACLEAIAEAGPPPKERLLFVNISPSVLLDETHALPRARLPERLVLELTERDGFDDLDALRRALDPWIAGGTRIAIDDTGAGYSSLQRAVQLLPEFLKLDRELISGIDRDRHRQALVAALVGFARQTGASLIAEGVERPAELAWLSQAGVAMAQGYLLARPAPPWSEVVARHRPQRAAVEPANEALAAALQTARTQREACEVVADHLFRRGGLMPSIYLELGGRLRCQAQRGLWQVLDGMLPSAGVTGLTYRTGKAQFLPDVSWSPEYLEAIPGVVSEYCVPLFAETSEPVGALNVESVIPLDDATCHDIGTCATLLGARLGELPPEQARVPLRRLAKTAANLVAVDDPARTPGVVLHAARELSAMDSALLATVGPTGALRVNAAVGTLAEALATADTSSLDRLFGALGPLTSVYSSGDTTGRILPMSEAFRGAGARSVIALPLIARGRRTGVLVVAHHHPMQLGPEQVEPLELLAILAGSCLEMATTVDELRHRAHRDSLTTLGNHSSFHARLEDTPADEPCSILMFDIDRFKAVNDRGGHLIGDQVLRQVAAALAATTSEAVYRVGGDEFAMLVPFDDPRRALALARQLATVADGVLAASGAALSSGIAVREPGEALIATLARADQALYRAKGEGGGCHLAGGS